MTETGFKLIGDPTLFTSTGSALTQGDVGEAGGAATNDVVAVFWDEPGNEAITHVMAVATILPATSAEAVFKFSIEAVTSGTREPTGTPLASVTTTIPDEDGTLTPTNEVYFFELDTPLAAAAGFRAMTYRADATFGGDDGNTTFAIAGNPVITNRSPYLRLHANGGAWGTPISLPVATPIYASGRCPRGFLPANIVTNDVSWNSSSNGLWRGFRRLPQTRALTSAVWIQMRTADAATYELRVTDPFNYYGNGENAAVEAENGEDCVVTFSGTHFLTNASTCLGRIAFPEFYHPPGVALDFKIKPTSATHPNVMQKYTFPTAILKESVFSDLSSLVSTSDDEHTVSTTENFWPMVLEVRSVGAELTSEDVRSEVDAALAAVGVNTTVTTAMVDIKKISQAQR